MSTSPPVFVRGLFLGLLAGFVVCYLVLSLPAGPGGGPEEDRLRNQIEAMRREREGLLRNIDEFRQVAERMTAAFEQLESRFLALEGRLAAEESGAEETPAP